MRSYLQRLRAQLEHQGTSRARVDRLLEEAAAHLDDRGAALVDEGLPKAEAMAEAERRFGLPDDIAIQIASLDARRFDMTRIRTVALCAACLIAGVLAGVLLTEVRQSARLTSGSARADAEMKRIEYVRARATELERRLAWLEAHAGAGPEPAFSLSAAPWPDAVPTGRTSSAGLLLSERLSRSESELEVSLQRIGFGRALEQQLPQVQQQIASLEARLPDGTVTPWAGTQAPAQ